MIRNVNRIDHVAGLVRPENYEATIARFAEVFDTKFYGPTDRPEAGMRVAVSLDTGIELITPLNDSPDTPFNKMLAAGGEHWISVVMGVKDMDQSCDHLARLGYKPMMRRSGLDAGDPYGGRLTRLDQAMYAPGVFAGLSVALCSAHEGVNGD
jgi:hypothetical protein